MVCETNNNRGGTDEAQGKNIMVDGGSTEKLVSPPCQSALKIDPPLAISERSMRMIVNRLRILLHIGIIVTPLSLNAMILRREVGQF